MAKQIHLGPKKSTLFTVVDDEDYEKLASMGKWHARKKKRTHYATHTFRDGSSTSVHNVLLGKAQEGMVIDHIDGDGLNNQKSNLRFATFSQNANHRIRKRVGCTSEYRGVRQTENGRWMSRLKANGVRKCLGTFATEIEAAKAYNDAGTRLLGEFFKPNILVVAPMAVELANHPIADGFSDWGFR